MTPLNSLFPVSWMRTKILALREDTIAEAALKDVFDVDFFMYFYCVRLHPLLITSIFGALMFIYFLYSSVLLYFASVKLTVHCIHLLCETLLCGVLSAVLIASTFCQKQYILAGLSHFFSFFSWVQVGKLLFAVAMALCPLSPVSTFCFGEDTVTKMEESAELREVFIYTWTLRIIVYYLVYQLLELVALVTAKCGVFFVQKKIGDKVVDSTYMTLC